MDVLEALGIPAGEDPLESLAAATGTDIPRPLAGLAGREVRFTGCVEKTEMQSLVDRHLS